MRSTFLFLLVLVSAKLFSQQLNPELFRTWYLVELNIAGTSYIPSEYGYYPDMDLSDVNAPTLYSITFADPDHDICSSEIRFSETAPELEFQLLEEPFCFPTSTCDGNPKGGCVILRDAQSGFYRDSVTTPLHYEITANQDGTFYLQITNNNGDTAYYGSEPFLSVPIGTGRDFSIYPNPASDILHLTGEVSPKRIDIFSPTGTLFFSETQPRWPLNISALPTGLYFLKLYDGNRVATKKIIKR